MTLFYSVFLLKSCTFVKLDFELYLFVLCWHWLMFAFFGISWQWLFFFEELLVDAVTDAG